jgi:hypothetical protein
MSDTFHIRVFGPDGSVVAESRTSAPFTLGRGDRASIRFAHAPEDTRISRIHAAVRSDGGRLLLTDESVNGTHHRGRHLRKGESAALADQDEFVVQTYRVTVQRVVSPTAGGPIIFHAIPGGRTGKRFPIGPSALVIETTANGPRLQEIGAFEPAAALRALRGQGRDAIAVLHADAQGGMLFVAPEAAGKGLSVNLAEVKPGSIRVGHLDMLKMGPLRLDLIRPGERALRCKNKECGRLNAWNPRLNCRFCGHLNVESPVTVLG